MSGNKNFVATIAARYGTRLRRFLAVRLRNADDVPNLAQEVFVRAGAKNVLDKNPPLLVAQTGIIAGGNANTSDAYDMFGRQLFVSFTAKFNVATVMSGPCGPLLSRNAPRVVTEQPMVARKNELPDALGTSSPIFH